MGNEKEIDVERLYSPMQTAAKWRRFADAIEAGESIVFKSAVIVCASRPMAKLKSRCRRTAKVRAKSRLKSNGKEISVLSQKVKA